MIFGKDKEMKTSYKIILVLIMAITAIILSPLPCPAAEKAVYAESSAASAGTEEDIWQEDIDLDAPMSQRPELTDERIEHIMNQMAQADPQEAQRLAKLRDEDPNKFKGEIRKVMHERFGERMRARGVRRSERELGMPPMGPEGRKPGQRGMRMMEAEERETEQRGMRIRERERECIEWMRKNYPAEVNELTELSKKNPELYTRKLDINCRRYRRIMEASEENPELANVLKKDLELKQERDKLLGRIRTADKADKQKLIKELEGIVSSQFDLIVKQRQIRYEQMRKRLERLQKQVQQGESEVEKWNSAEFKNKSVKARVEELISKTEKFNWD